MPETTEEDLLKAAKEGSDDALGQLFDRVRLDLLSFLYRMSGNREAAQDLLQETFLRLTRNRLSYEFPRPARAWIYTIARNLALNRARRPGFASLTAIVEDSGWEPEGREEAKDQVVTKEDLQRLSRAIQDLPEGTREAVTLRKIEELDYDDIARMLGTTPGAVRERVRFGLEKLRTLMGSP